MGNTQEDGVTAVLGCEGDQKQQASVWPEPLGFVRELQPSSKSGCGRSEGRQPPWQSQTVLPGNLGQDEEWGLRM